jgi:hypothetical protein
VSDYGFEEYNILRTRVLAAATHTNITTVSGRVTMFVQDEDNNPVYCDSLVNMLMAQGYKVLSTLAGESPTHDLMVTRLIARHVGTTHDVWQRTMEHNATNPEG